MKEDIQTKENLGPIVSPTQRDKILSFAFIVIWLIPVACVGLTERSVPYAPVYLKNLHRVSCLFTKSVSGWNSFYFQAQLKNSYEWITLDEADYSRMQPFGHCTRFHRMLDQSNHQRHGMLQRQRMAEFIKRRYEELYPDSEVEAVRYIVVVFQTSGELVKPKGRWVHEPLDSIPIEERRLLSSHYFDGRSPRNGLGEAVQLNSKRK